MALPTSWFQPSETDFRLLPSKTVREHISVALSHPVVVFCYSSPGKLITWSQGSDVIQV